MTTTTVQVVRRSPFAPWRDAAVAIAAAALAALAGCGSGQDAQAGPGLVARLPDGRGLNFRCTGSGSPVVLLESGFGVGAAGWGRSQPRLAKLTRVCSYDRAGYGFSDPGPAPRDGAAIARDLDQGLTAAGIKGPFVVVGHSAGALYARLFAARRPGEVKGLILLDPTIEARPGPGGDGLDGIRRRLSRCLAAAQSQVPTQDPQWKGCLPAKPSAHDLSLAQQPVAWASQFSELDEIFGRTSDQAMRIGGLLSDVPAYVITASDSAAAAPTLGYTSQSILELQHTRLALSFAQGSQRTVLSSHIIQNDRPEIVEEAVAAMVRAVRAGAPPAVLPASETERPPGEEAFPQN